MSTYAVTMVVHVEAEDEDESNRVADDLQEFLQANEYVKAAFIDYVEYWED